MATSHAITPPHRGQHLRRLRNEKMARSAHAYVRGNTLKFYEWLERAGDRRIPEGPPVWICGDCHIGNLGPLADADGGINMQVRDLDQTVIGNPSHDLIRLGMSLATAARGSDLPGVTTARMVEEMILGYEEALGHDDPEFAEHRPECITVTLRQAVDRTWKHLARERIEDERPTIPLGRKFWPLSSEERSEIERIFATEETRRLVTGLRHRPDGASVEVVDAAYWVKGCSSLGRLRFAVLLGIGKKYREKGRYCLMDIKEAVQAAAPRYAAEGMPRDNAVRVVEGACSLSPALGERMMPERFLGRGVFIRELMPQDLKLEIDEISQDEAMKAARYLAMVVGKGHARQMRGDQRRAWNSELKRNRGSNLDAPHWLWSSIVDLMATHEAAYLEHCRKYVLNPDG
ncbi:MAG: DUF2252 family protein [Alphaproteobacteria bacterium]|nr:DUF2252 family protein [Alphaproteobacteria bacterium]